MPTLTTLKTLPKPPYKVELFIDGLLWETVPRDVILKLRLIPGMAFPDDLREAVRHQVQMYEAREIALRLLARRERSAGEIRQRLRLKGLSDFADKTIDDLKAKDYLNDERFATLFTRDKINLKRWGPQRIRAELYAKSVSKAVIEKVIGAAFRDQDQTVMISELIAKKVKGKTAITDKERQRVWNFLIRRGYNSSDITRVLRNYDRLSE